MMTADVLDAVAGLWRDTHAVFLNVGVVGTHTALLPWQDALIGRVWSLTRRWTRGGRPLVHHARAARLSWGQSMTTVEWWWDKIVSPHILQWGLFRHHWLHYIPSTLIHSSTTRALLQDYENAQSLDVVLRRDVTSLHITSDNVNNTMRFKVGSTSFVDVVSTSDNDAVPTSGTDVETMSKTRCI